MQQTTTRRKKKPPEERTIFALDIGTRSVIGLVAVMRDERLTILDHERLEYTQRAMRDGQIEDIDLVAQCISKVRQHLEERLGIKLKKAAIAAAGRALQTRRITVERKLNRSEIINTETIRMMELNAIEQAQTEIMNAETERQRDFYCVGHTIINYTLDGYEMAEVQGHYGSVCVMTVIAAFLPRAVVESLYSAVEKSGLEVDSLTLEPIAAMNMVIPQEVRMLNLALVDIGAGTSDIAISKAGEVIAYDMVTLAGDELTENLMKQYLVDFDTAEQIKRQLHDQTDIKFIDILGFEQTITYDETVQVMNNTVDNLVDVVADKILELNGVAPTALYLVGGGSMYVGLAQKFAQRLQLNEQRVTVGSGNWLPKLVAQSEAFASPDYVTPLGIALTAFMVQPYRFTAVTVNGKKVRQFRYEGLKVMDVLVLSGHYKYEQLVGRIGKRLRFELNGHIENIAGGLAKPAQILLNNEPVGLEALVRPGDVIDLVPAENGADAKRSIGEIIGELEQFNVYYDGQSYQAGKWVLRDQVIVDPSALIKEGDSLQTVELRTIAQLAEVLGETGNRCLINGQLVTADTLLQPEDDVAFLPPEEVEEEPPVVNDETEAEPELVIEEPAVVTPAAEERLVQQPAAATVPEIAQPVITPTAAEVSARPAKIAVILNGKPLMVSRKEDGEMPMLFDMFNYIDQEVLSKRDHALKALINGQEQAFTTYLQDGDHIDIG